MDFIGPIGPNHFAAPLYQQWARDDGVFEEVLLFMDCCGTTGRESLLRRPIYDLKKNIAAVKSGRWFYAAACKPGQKTREKTVLHGAEKRGVFSLCLLDALSGRAVEQGTKTITSWSLTKYLTEQMKKLLDPPDWEDEEIAQKAERGSHHARRGPSRRPCLS